MEKKKKNLINDASDSMIHDCNLTELHVCRHLKIEDAKPFLIQKLLKMKQLLLSKL